MIVLMLMLAVALFLPVAVLVTPLLSWGASNSSPSAPPCNGETNNAAQELRTNPQAASATQPSGTVATLLAAIESRQWYVRQGAARQLGRLGLVSWPAIPALEQAALLVF